MQQFSDDEILARFTGAGIAKPEMHLPYVRQALDQSAEHMHGRVSYAGIARGTQEAILGHYVQHAQRTGEPLLHFEMGPKDKIHFTYREPKRASVPAFLPSAVSEPHTAPVIEVAPVNPSGPAEPEPLAAASSSVLKRAGEMGKRGWRKALYNAEGELSGTKAGAVAAGGAALVALGGYAVAHRERRSDTPSERGI